MKKSIKRFLVLTQVLGWSALVATACTDTDKPVSKTADVSKANAKTKTNDNNNSEGEDHAKTTKPGETASASEGEDHAKTTKPEMAS